MKNLKINHLIITSLIAASLLSLGCNKSKPNDLNRPAAENQNTETNTNPETQTDNGDVEGINTTPLPTKEIFVGEIVMTTEVADTDEARQQGLSGREKLDDGSGMLFDFTNVDFKMPGFYMKDMLISIDIIWINNGKIIGIKNDAPLPPVDADLPVYYPPSEVTHVLEVPAGWSAKNNVVVGTTVTL